MGHEFLRWLKDLPEEEAVIAVDAVDIILMADDWYELGKTQPRCMIADELLHVGFFGLRDVAVERFDELVECMVRMAERHGIQRARAGGIDVRNRYLRRVNTLYILDK